MRCTDTRTYGIFSQTRFQSLCASRFGCLGSCDCEGVVDTPLPGGLSLEEAEEIIVTVASRFEIAAASVTTYNPDMDEKNRSARVASRLIGSLVKSIACRS